MKKYVFAITLLTCCGIVMSQDYDRTIIHAGEDLASYYTFRFPTFDDATVLFKTGNPVVAKMNFNMLLCKMEFINEKGDTVEVSKPGGIDRFVFKTSSFLYDKSYYEVIGGTSDSVMLLVLRTAHLEAVKIGAMGTAAHSVTIDSYDVLLSPIGDKGLTPNQDIYAYRKTEYFLALPGGEKLPSGKSSFLKVFSKDRKRIQAFMKSNSINYNSQKDLIKLFQFCSQTGR